MSALCGRAHTIFSTTSIRRPRTSYRTLRPHAAVAVIVFREVLEAALIVSIVMAASVGVAGRSLWTPAVLKLALGAGLGRPVRRQHCQRAAGIGSRVLNAGVLSVAVCMLGWHNLWMARHARQMADAAKAIGRQVAEGCRPLTRSA